MRLVPVFSFAIGMDGSDDVAQIILLAARLALQPATLDSPVLPLQLEPKGEGRYLVLALVDATKLASAGSFSDELISRTQSFVARRVGSLGWSVREIEPCSLKVAAPGSAMLAHKKLRKIACESADGISVSFFDANGAPRFDVTLGGRFARPDRNPRSVIFGKVSHISHRKKYRVLYVVDFDQGQRSVLLPDRVAQVPKEGSTIFAVLNPLRSSRLGWQLESYFAIQRDFFEDS